MSNNFNTELKILDKNISRSKNTSNLNNNINIKSTKASPPTENVVKKNTFKGISEQNRSRHKDSDQHILVGKPVAKALNDLVYDETTLVPQPVTNFRKQSLASAQKDVIREHQEQPVKELDDYVLIFNKPQKDSSSSSSSTIPIPQSKLF